MLLRSAKEEMHRWREHFQTVLNHEEPLSPPEVEPSDELNIRTGRITRIEVKNATKKLKWEGAKVGLKINATKTKLMGIGTKRGDGVLVAGGRIEEVDEFTYLGSIVSKKGGTDEDIQARIGKARQAFAMLRPIW